MFFCSSLDIIYNGLNNVVVFVMFNAFDTTDDFFLTNKISCWNKNRIRYKALWSKEVPFSSSMPPLPFGYSGAPALVIKQSPGNHMRNDRW